MKARLNWQIKAIVIFAVIIILLSIILAVFAIREAEREKLVLERKIAEDQERSAGLIIGQVNTFIKETEGRIDALLQEDKIPPDEEVLSQACQRIVESEKIINEIFFIEEKGQVIFPLARPLFSLPGERREARKDQTSLDTLPLFKEAERYEFELKNYPLAISAYQRLIITLADRANRAVLMNCIGRCYIKLRKHPEAIRTYQTILERYTNELTPDGIPVGLLAQYQIGNIYSSINRRKGVEAFIELYNGLLEPRWPLNRSQFRLYKNKAKSSFDELTTDNDESQDKKRFQKKWDELELLEGEKLKETQSKENLIQRVIPLLKTEKPSTRSTTQRFSHHSQTIEKETYLVTYAALTDNSILGIRIDPEALAAKLRPLNQNSLPLRDDWHIQVRDGSGNIVAGRDISHLKKPAPKLSFSRRFDEDFPPWEVHIYQSDPDSIKRNFNLRRNIYLLSVIIVMLAILSGGFLAIKATGKELELAKLKSEFVSTVSHELRTPLTSIRYLAELLKRGRVKEENKKHMYYETITDESERLSRLIENILDFSKIEAGMKEYQFKETNVTELTQNVSSRFQEQFAPKGFIIKNEISDRMPRLTVDKEALSRALFNLLDNAVKYSGESSKVILRAWSERGHVFLEVEDKGVGINKEDQKKVFDKFYRSDNIDGEAIKGSGIGLTLVSHIVKAHGGVVHLESDAGTGTKVTLKLPVKRK